MYRYIETVKQQTNEVVKRMDVSQHSERVSCTFLNAVSNGIRDNQHVAKMNESSVPLVVGDLIEN